MTEEGQDEVWKIAYELEKKAKRKKKAEDKEKEERTTRTSFYEDELFHCEQVYKDGITRFCTYIRDTGNIEYHTALQIGSRIIAPIEGEEVNKEIIGLPSEPIEYGSTEALREEIECFINEWVDIPDEHFVRFTTYNILKSWVYQRFHTINYNRFLGEHGTGKSRALDVIGLLHYKPIATSGALTSAVIFRIINKWGGTIIIDEADFGKSDESQDIIKILNQGYEKGRHVLRCDPNNLKVQFFCTYCPKVIATRKYFEDKALESRCLTYVMKTTQRKDIPPNITDDFQEKLRTLRNKLLQWRFDNYYTIKPDLGASIDLGDIEPRLRQVSTGFAAMLAGNEKELNNFRAYLGRYQLELRSERANTIEGRIVHGIAELILEGNKELTAQQIIYRAELIKKDGGYWNPRAITKYMKILGLGTAILKRVEGVSGKFYFFDLDEVFMLVKKYSDDVNFVNKFCNHVTEVTVHVEGIAFFKKGQIDLNSHSVTVTPPLTKERYNGYTVTSDMEEKGVCEHGNKEKKDCLFCKQKEGKE